MVRIAFRVHFKNIYCLGRGPFWQKKLFSIETRDLNQKYAKFWQNVLFFIVMLCKKVTFLLKYYIIQEINYFMLSTLIFKAKNNKNKLHIYTAEFLLIVLEP